MLEPKDNHRDILYNETSTFMQQGVFLQMTSKPSARQWCEELGISDSKITILWTVQNLGHRNWNAKKRKTAFLGQEESGNFVLQTHLQVPLGSLRTYLLTVLICSDTHNLENSLPCLKKGNERRAGSRTTLFNMDFVQ